MSLQGNAAQKTLYGTEYRIGCVPCLLYKASGTAVDWAYAQAGIKYSYSIELRDGLDEKGYGFLLPPEQIIPTGQEMYAFQAAVAREIIKEFA